MKEVGLYDAKNKLSALIAEVEASGEEILITRHGKPAARLGPATAPQMTQAEAAARLRELQEEIAAAGTDSEPLPWETLKRWMRDEEDE
ncbi:MAG TPA: type II toxin-antitoxin system Phd/YefM family antitoxin [Caulobacterales bacterium]|nr:type II toxin-antitoxin system Phd/YefM family antitoxin [Caulobacterales bacterium]